MGGLARPGAVAEKSAALAAMAVTAAWTVAVVCALMLAVLLLSAWGTAGGSCLVWLSPQLRLLASGPWPRVMNAQTFPGSDRS